MAWTGRRLPIFPLVVAGYLSLLGVIWLTELLDLPHRLFGAECSGSHWEAALLHSAAVTVVAALLGVLLRHLARQRRHLTGVLTRRAIAGAIARANES